jgi:serine/threonine-protein kinase
MGEPFQLGRYALHAELAAGGMAVVYLARQTGAVGFGRTVAIKRLHPHLARDPYFVTMFLDEARLAARVVHPNVVPILDVVSTDNELFLVLEYVRGETLSGLLRAARKANAKIPVPIAAAIASGLLAGLHAAHEAKDELGHPLHIVHRDVSPQNLIVGADGVSRVLDFGVAKAATRLQTTREGQLKGKIPYMAPEQLAGNVTAQSDVYSSALVLWEALTSRRLFRGETEAQVLHLVMTAEAPAPSTLNPEVPPALDAVVMKGLAREPSARWATARDMAVAIESAVPIASAMKVAEWVHAIIGPTIAARDAMRAEIESGSHSVNSLPAPMSTPSLPAFPQIGESSASLPRIEASGPIGVAESTASLVVGAQKPVARSRTPLVVAGVAAACLLSLGIGVAVSRVHSAARVDGPPETTTPATMIPPSASAEPIATLAPMVVPLPAPTTSAAPSASAASSAHHKTHSHAAPTQTGSNDLNSLLDTR